MAKSKKTKKAPKVSVARVLGLLLLGLLAAGAVANVIKALPKEEEPTEEVETLSVVVKVEDACTEYFDGKNELVFEYEEGMTIIEWVESEYNTFGFTLEDSCIGYCIDTEYDDHIYLYGLESEDYGVPDFESTHTFDSFIGFYVGA